jgi:hypothetical protein
LGDASHWIQLSAQREREREREKRERERDRERERGRERDRERETQRERERERAFALDMQQSRGFGHINAESALRVLFMTASSARVASPLSWQLVRLILVSDASSATEADKVPRSGCPEMCKPVTVPLVHVTPAHGPMWSSQTRPFQDSNTCAACTGNEVVSCPRRSCLPEQETCTYRP